MGRDQVLASYQLIKTLGKGRYSTVKLAKQLMTDELVAVKIVSKTDNTPKELEILMQEMRVMKMLDHPSIVKLYEILESDEEIFIVMEYVVGKDLNDWPAKHRKSPTFMDDIAYILYQLADALAYCHKHFVVHRDIKPANILVTKLGTAKIVDWGLSNTFIDLLATHCGTPFFAAPELFVVKKYAGPPIDVWALGVVIYYVVCGEFPFVADNLAAFAVLMKDCKFKPIPNIDPQLSDLLRKMLTKDPEQRITAEQVCQHPWLRLAHEKQTAILAAKRKQREKKISESASYFSVTHADDEVDPEVLLVMTTLLKFNEDDVRQAITSKWYNNTASTYYLLRNTKYLEDYVELAKLHKSGRTITHNLDKPRRKSSLMTSFKKNLGVAPDERTYAM